MQRGDDEGVAEREGGDVEERHVGVLLEDGMAGCSAEHDVTEDAGIVRCLHG